MIGYSVKANENVVDVLHIFSTCVVLNDGT